VRVIAGEFAGTQGPAQTLMPTLLWHVSVEPGATFEAAIPAAFEAGAYVIEGEGRFGDREPVDVARLQQMKTGALLRFGCVAGAILGQSSRQEYQALDDYGRALGEAFQIADDLLDVEGDAAALGKPAGADAALGKTTFVTQLGIEGAKQRVRDLLARADSAVSIFGERAAVLQAAARFVAERKS